MGAGAGAGFGASGALAIGASAATFFWQETMNIKPGITSNKANTIHNFFCMVFPPFSERIFGLMVISRKHLKTI
jgi:hypothetical protein